MLDISIETWGENGVTVLMYKNVIKWLKMHDIQIGLNIKNMSDLTIKETEGIYGKKGKNLQKNKFKYIKHGLLMGLFTTPTVIEFRSKLGFKQYDLIMTKEQSVVMRITKIFAREEILLQHSVFK